MATQSPISTISYNSEDFLKDKLDSWIDSHLIQSYMYIKHIGEDGDKNHIHLRIEPNKRLDVMCLSEELREYVPDNNKPLCCRPFRPSREEDWFLYAVHDKEYLRLKYSGGEKGEKLPYHWSDIVTNDFYDVECAFIRAKASMLHTSVNMASRIRDGCNPLDLILEGENPHTVNAIVQSINKFDVPRLQADIHRLNGELINIFSTLSENGLHVECDDLGVYSLKVNS